MKIPRVNPMMKKQTPNQFCEIINKLVDKSNDLEVLEATLTKTFATIDKTLVSLQEQIDEIRPTPPTPTGDYIQVKQFDISKMGNTPGMCLQNTRLGFSIPTGTFPTARADMESQISNGTLHEGTPPSDISVPIYFANYSFTPAGHVAVWDHGIVYSDKRMYASIDAVAPNYTGWGELCDGVRVVEHK